MPTIFDYIKNNENEYIKPIKLDEGWDWSMKSHLRRSFLYKNSQFEDKNDNRELRPNKNIILGILNVQYRTEGFDVKDIEIYVDDSDEYYKSFLVKKFHDKWVLENQIDTFIDDIVYSYVDYGGTLARNTGDSRPEVIDLRGLAFCNQKNILAYPFCIKHSLSPSQLREFDIWGDGNKGATIDKESLITLCKDEKEIVIYELHGNLPSEWLLNVNTDKKDIQQIQIVAFYKDQNKQEQGVILFRNKEPKLPFKFLLRDEIIGRALGRGGIEELFEDQIWTNWNEIKITEMLEAASKIIFKSSDPTIKGKHPSGLKNLDNLEILNIQAGSDISQLDTAPRNLVVFNNAVERWQNHAQIISSASETLLGETPTAGMPFKLYEAKNIEDKSMHKFRQGQIAVFVDEIYRDWILPHITEEISKDNSFLTELSSDEMQKVVDSVVINEANDFKKKIILSGQIVQDSMVKDYEQTIRQSFLKDNKKFIKILRGEMTKPLSVSTNIVGKQKNLALFTDKLVNVMRQFISTPQIRQDPEMVKLLNVILESSGMSPIIFGASMPQQMLQAPQNAPQGQTGALQMQGAQPLMTQ